MQFLGWIVGLLLIGAASFCLGWLYINRWLIKGEIDLMKDDEGFENEPDYMQRFRVSRSEWDLVDNNKHISVAIAFLVIGIAMIVLMIVF